MWEMEIVKLTREARVGGKYDVIVIGGGLAGLSAAIAAARAGAITRLTGLRGRGSRQGEGLQSRPRRVHCWF